ncbi:MAG: hypothetical protein DRJ63_07410 [Thermoprotei archaeon]|nr:MAG: hypothetical protein DRJ63_07410 [Thermoprotei archaeon]
MAYESPDSILFGVSKKTLKYGFELEVGCGKVVPEIKYWPNRSAEEDLSKTVEEYEKITKDILVRAVDPAGNFTCNCSPLSNKTSTTISFIFMRHLLFL